MNCPLSNQATSKLWVARAAKALEKTPLESFELGGGFCFIKPGDTYFRAGRHVWKGEGPAAAGELQGKGEFKMAMFGVGNPCTQHVISWLQKPPPSQLGKLTAEVGSDRITQEISGNRSLPYAQFLATSQRQRSQFVHLSLNYHLQNQPPSAIESHRRHGSEI